MTSPQPPVAHEHSTRYVAWTRALAIILALLLLFLWWQGYGPHRANCCSANEAVVSTVPAPVAAPSAPAMAPAVVVAAPAAIDPCAATVAAEVAFNTGSTTVSPAGKQALNAMVACLKVKSATIEGHTDNVGVAALNLALSEKRAQAVQAYLVSQGVPAANLTATGLGDTQPKADNANEAGRATNRRMDIRLK